MMIIIIIIRLKLSPKWELKIHKVLRTTIKSLKCLAILQNTQRSEIQFFQPTSGKNAPSCLAPKSWNAQAQNGTLTPGTFGTWIWSSTACFVWHVFKIVSLCLFQIFPKLTCGRDFWYLIPSSKLTDATTTNSPWNENLKLRPLRLTKNCICAKMKTPDRGPSAQTELKRTASKTEGYPIRGPPLWRWSFCQFGFCAKSNRPFPFLLNSSSRPLTCFLPHYAFLLTRFPPLFG